MNYNFQNNSALKEKRRLLIQQLRKRGIKDENVLNAMNKIPREYFIDPAIINRTYDDAALPIDCEQTISQPYTVAYMTEALKIEKGDKILEIGTGSGYQACVLYEMGAKVFTIERIKNLYESSKEIFSNLNININQRLGDGTLGWQDMAPFQGIIVTAAAPKIPNLLKQQLAIGAKLIIPVGDKNTQIMYIVEREADSEFIETSTDSFKFVTLIGKEGWKND